MTEEQIEVEKPHDTWKSSAYNKLDSQAQDWK